MKCPLFAALCASLLIVPAKAQSIAEFYTGRTISLVVGYVPGSGNDLLSRLVAKYMRNHLPGHPALVVQNMPGVGGIKAATYLYKAAPRDGSAFGFVGRNSLLAPLLDPASAAFDGRKFNWIGSASRTVLLGISWHTSPVKTLADATRMELLVGSPSLRSEGTRMALLYNATLGTKFKVVTGYPETQLFLALERGELAGQIGLSYDSLITSRGAWLTQKKINLLVQSGLHKDPRLAAIPLAIDAVKTAADRRLMEFLFGVYEFARPFTAPPGVPRERVAALRDAFMATLRDRQFLAEASTGKIEIDDPAAGEKVAAFVAKAYATAPEIVSRARALTQKGP